MCCALRNKQAIKGVGGQEKTDPGTFPVSLYIPESIHINYLNNITKIVFDSRNFVLSVYLRVGAFILSKEVLKTWQEKEKQKMKMAKWLINQ
jgi:hypothetical protein